MALTKEQLANTYCICENQQQQDLIADKLIELGYKRSVFTPNSWDISPFICVTKAFFYNDEKMFNILTTQVTPADILAIVEL